MIKALYEHPDKFSKRDIAADFLMGFATSGVCSDIPIDLEELADHATASGLTREDLREGRKVLGGLITSSTRNGHEAWRIEQPHPNLFLVVATSVARERWEDASLHDHQLLQDMHPLNFAAFTRRELARVRTWFRSAGRRSVRLRLRFIVGRMHLSAGTACASSAGLPSFWLTPMVDSFQAASAAM